jgi:hypothetical protein
VARADGKAEIQHYVPKMLLRRFANRNPKGGREPQIYVFDKHAKRAFKTSVSNVVAERGFYDFDVAGEAVSVEPSLSRLEARTAVAFERLLETRDLLSLTNEDREGIAAFIAVQHLRTRHFREVLVDQDRQLSEFLKARGHDPNTISNYQHFENENELKEFATRFLIEALPELTGQLFLKTWVLMDALDGQSFIIGDNPVTFHNDLDFGPLGNIGFGVKGVQIHLPVSPDLTLALWCPSISEQFREAVDNGKKAINQCRTLLSIGYNIDAEVVRQTQDRAERALANLQPLVDGVEQGKSVKCVADNMDFFNSLQARWAERYALGSNPNFAIVERMLREHPHARVGPRMKIG